MFNDLLHCDIENKIRSIYFSIYLSIFVQGKFVPKFSQELYSLEYPYVKDQDISYHGI